VTVLKCVFGVGNVLPSFLEMGLAQLVLVHSAVKMVPPPPLTISGSGDIKIENGCYTIEHNWSPIGSPQFDFQMRNDGVRAEETFLKIFQCNFWLVHVQRRSIFRFVSVVRWTPWIFLHIRYIIGLVLLSSIAVSEEDILETDPRATPFSTRCGLGRESTTWTWI